MDKPKTNVVALSYDSFRKQVEIGTLCVYKIKECAWCKRTIREKLLGFERNDTVTAYFEYSGTGKIVIVPFETDFDRKEICLCSHCVRKLYDFLEKQEADNG